jgi:hypothetical protein
VLHGIGFPGVSHHATGVGIVRLVGDSSHQQSTTVHFRGSAMPKSPSNHRSRLQAGRLAVLGAAGVVTAAALATAGTVPVAQAVPVTVDPFAPALGFNAFVEDETVLVSTESEGGIATGGNLVVSGSYNVDIHDASMFIAQGDAVPSALVVGGQIDFTQDPAASRPAMTAPPTPTDRTGRTDPARTAARARTATRAPTAAWPPPAARSWRSERSRGCWWRVARWR